MGGFLPVLRDQEFCKVVGVLVGIVEGRGLLILPGGSGMSILLNHKFEGEVQVGYLSLPGVVSRCTSQVYHFEFGTVACSDNSKNEMQWPWLKFLKYRQKGGNSVPFLGESL